MERAVILRLLSTLKARSASLLHLVESTGGKTGPHTETIRKEISVVHDDCRRLLWHFEKHHDHPTTDSPPQSKSKT
jgi:hypothetical protein